MLGRHRMLSPNSDMTAFPAVEESPSPSPESEELRLTTMNLSSSPLGHPLSLNETSAWPTAPRSPLSSIAQRSYSTSLDSRRNPQRRGRRTNSDRNMWARSMSNSSTSPASTFLANWGSRGVTAPPEPDDEGQEIEEYVIGKEIGRGGNSVVKEASTIENGRRVYYAVKILRKNFPSKTDQGNEQLQADFEHEIQIWRMAKNRHILPLIKVYEIKGFATLCFTKLVKSGSLHDLISKNRKGLSTDLAKRYSFHIARAIRYLHQDRKVIHRDIKLENCLLDMSDPNVAAEGGNVLLCDFGMAEEITGDGTSEIRNGPQHQYERELLHYHREIGPSETAPFRGSLQYNAPELFSESSECFTTAVDIWAFGVVLFTLLSGRLPFQHALDERVRSMIEKGEWDEEALRSAEGVRGSEQDVLDLLKGCLALQVESRWDIRQVLASRWLKGCMEEEDGETGGSWGALG